MRVVLPQPEGPSRPVMVPAGRSKVSPCSVSRPPRLTRRLVTWTAGAAEEAEPRSSDDDVTESGEPLTFFII